ncbi:MAG: hypothetical protein PHE83_16550 [Opitutaceae bacterium]|nr:hypothetical protein [Opitutaceae bacterium]
MNDDPLDEMCRLNCTCRTRTGCRLKRHPFLANREFNIALILKTLINGKTLDEIKGPMIDVLEEAIAFEKALPESCRAVWEKSRPEWGGHSPEEFARFSDWIDHQRKEKGVD